MSIKIKLFQRNSTRAPHWDRKEIENSSQCQSCSLSYDVMALITLIFLMTTAFQTGRCRNGHMDRTIQEQRSRSAVRDGREVSQCWMWVRLHSCPLPEPKTCVMPLGEAAKGTEANLLRVIILNFCNHGFSSSEFWTILFKFISQSFFGLKLYRIVLSQHDQVGVWLSYWTSELVPSKKKKKPTKN